MAKKSRHRRGLPAEIEREILIRLPVKTLRRFQSTCKSWYSLISSPQFQQDHQFFHSRNNPLLLTVREVDEDHLQFSAYTNSKEETLVNTFSKNAPYICEAGMLPIQSCQGLICLASSFSTIPSILICNPSTEELIVLPQSQQRSDCFGFGYAASTEEFKVVNFGNSSVCEVFTLGSAHWREAMSPPYYGWGVAPFLHGALHLPHAPLEEDNDYIAAFDLETEEYKCIPLPTCYRSTVKRFVHQEMENIRLVVLRGSLPQSQQRCECFGFGYAASTEEFKVVNFGNSINGVCEVFTLGSAHWREARSPPYFSWGVAPFLHGALHLPPVPLEEDKDYIAAFDLETEEYKCIPLPTCYRSKVKRYDFLHQDLENIQLVVLRGSLCLIFAFGPCLEFLILKDYNNGEWEKGYTIDMSCAIDGPRMEYYPVEAIGIMGDGSVLLGDPKFMGADLWCYDPQDRFFTQKFDDILAAAFYEESFFSLGTR